LRSVPDPRPGGARRHPTAFVLAVLVMSFASAGFAWFAGAAQWAANADPALLRALGAVPDPLTGAVCPPSEATVRRVASRVDRDAVEAVVAGWTAARLAQMVRTHPGARTGPRQSRVVGRVGGRHAAEGVKRHEHGPAGDHDGV